MKSTVQLNIDTPCHENWAAMAPTDEGRFCQACTKQVVDFSIMTDQQILHYLSETSGSICGRMGNDQMNRPLVQAAVQPKAKWWWTMLMPLLMVFDRVFAQKQTVQQKKGEVAVRSRSIPAIAQVQYTISGTVRDENGQPPRSFVLSIS